MAKWLSGCGWHVSWSERVKDAEESGQFMEKGELSCVGKSEDSKMGSKIEGKTQFKYTGRTWGKWTRPQHVLAV